MEVLLYIRTKGQHNEGFSGELGTDVTSLSLACVTDSL